MPRKDEAEAEVEEPLQAADLLLPRIPAHRPRHPKGPIVFGPQVVAGEEIRVIDEQRRAAAGVARNRNHDEARLELDGILPLDLPLDHPGPSGNVGAMQDPFATESIVQRFLIGDVVPMGEEKPARSAHRVDAIEERLRCARRVDDDVAALAHDEIAGRAVRRLRSQSEVVNGAVDVQRQRGQRVADFPSLRAADGRRRAGHQRDQRVLALGRRGLPLHEGEPGPIRPRERRRRELPAGVAVDAGRIHEERPRGILRKTQVEPGHERWCNQRPAMAQADTRLEKRLLHDVGRAIRDFDLVREGDRILVAVSGGKDSFTLLHLLQKLQRRAPIHFDLVACNLDQGHPGFPAARLEAYLRDQGVEVRMLREDTYSQVLRLTEPGKTLCTVCSRLRRGILYSAAREMGCSKIALGHHRDDLIESLLLSMLFAGKMRSMPPRLVSDDGRNVVIRPLCYAAEADIAEFARSAAFPIIPCDLCGSQDDLMRKRVKRLLGDLEREHPGVRHSLFASMGNILPEHLLDARLYPHAEQSGPDPWLDAEDELERDSLLQLGQPCRTQTL